MQTAVNIGVGLNHDLNLSQQLNLAPQLLQWLRILQAPTTELHDIVRQELETNPALETEYGDDSAIPDTPSVADNDDPREEGLDERDSDSARLEAIAELDSEWREDMSRQVNGSSSSYNDDMERRRYMLDSVTARCSLHEHLARQIPLLDIPESVRPIAETIIGFIDDSGYLSASSDEIADSASVSPDKVEEALKAVQTMDPPGIGARDLSECLLLQMTDLPPDAIPRVIVGNYLDPLACGQFKEIAEAMDIDESDVIDAVNFLKTLNRTPGDAFSGTTAEYVVPDVTIYRADGHFEIDLNDNGIPHVRISSACRAVLDSNRMTPREAAYVRGKLRSAAFLIQGIRQRQDTLRKVAEQIVTIQRDFFERETGRLKPLTMAKVAGILGVHETTVSRTLANKYVRTPKGVYEMKHFFKPGYRCADGTSVTPETVKDRIRSMVREEDRTRPMKDSSMSDMLGKRYGLKVARRTIAKYREEMGIPSSKERKLC